MSDNCLTLLLADTPSSHDEFGSHERVADAIAQMMHDESGGKCIGLEGTWGSGKSTVIKLLDSKLADGANSNSTLPTIF